MKRLIFIVILLSICLVPVVLEAAPKVYPVKRVFGFRQKALASSPAFQKWVAARSSAGEMREARSILSKEFETEFKKTFGLLTADNITDKNKHEVLVASLHLLRASEYTVPKIGFSEVSMPITLSIIITNPATGEALYSFTKTSYATTRVVKTNVSGAETEDQKASAQSAGGQEQLPTAAASDAQDAEEDREMFVNARPSDQEQAQMIADAGANYQALVMALIKEAKAGYNPSNIEIKIADVWKGLYILDKGSKYGIVKDDTIQDASANELTVIHSAEDYAVAQSLLGKVDRGGKFFKYSTGSAAGQFNKPRVLTMHEGWGDPILRGISYIFDSEISKESAFTLLPVNEHFTRLLHCVAQDTYAGKYETTNQRIMPDYLIKFSATRPRFYTISEAGKFGHNVYEQSVVGELLDRQGRILFSAVGTDRIEDKNVAGMVFAVKDRLEILLKNATLKLAEQFSRSIRFSRFVLPVTGADGKIIEIKDTSRDLRIGKDVIVYRKIGNINGIATEIVVPLWQAVVVEVQNDTAKLDLIMKLTDQEISVSADDVVILDAMSTSDTANQSNTSIKYCTHERSQRGPLIIDDFQVLSRSYGYLSPYTLYDQDEDFTKKIRAAAKFGGFRDTLELNKTDTAGRCVLPVYRASRGEKGTDQTIIHCDEKGICTDTIEIAVGYRLYINDERKGGSALKTKVTVNDCQRKVCGPVMQGALSKALHELLKDNITKLNYK
ncbi:MAG: hypothetical protein PHN97_11655 [Smithellaceae bacterium]|nr:hypothetical protein [Smithellaceae bacterium]